LWIVLSLAARDAVPKRAMMNIETVSLKRKENLSPGIISLPFVRSFREVYPTYCALEPTPCHSIVCAVRDGTSIDTSGGDAGAGGTFHRFAL